MTSACDPPRLREPRHRNLPIRPVAVALALAALTCLAFAPALDNQFVNWDDEANFLNNARFRGLGTSQVAWALTTFHMGAYQPVSWLVLSAEWTAWGLSPRGYHGLSILLHSATVVALFGLTLRLLRRAGFGAPGIELWAGFAVAAYATHPLRVEAVAWVSCQPYLLCGLFFVLAILAYLRACDATPEPDRRWLGASWLLYGLSLLCKAPSVGLPLVLLVLDVYPLGRLGGGPGRWFSPAVRPVWREKTPFFVLGVLFSVVAYMAKSLTFNAAPIGRGGVLTHAAAASYSAWFYAWKTLVPRNLTAYYVVPGLITWSQPAFLTALFAMLVLVVVLFLLRTRWPGFVAACVAWLMILAPVSGLVSLSTQLVADRYTYFAAMAWAAPVGAALSLLAGRGRLQAAALVLLCLVVLAALTRETRHLCRTWHDSESLWTHALHHGSDKSPMVYNNLAAVYHARGELDRAIEIYRAGLTAAPGSPDQTGRVLLHSNLAGCLERQGRLDAAAREHAALARLQPQSANPHYQWGRVLLLQERYAEAVPHFEQALRIDPNHAGAYQGLVVARERRGMPSDAERRH